MPDPSAKPDPTLPERSFPIPIVDRGKQVPGMVTGTMVWTVLSYPKQPHSFRIARGRLVAANEDGATVENTGMIFSGIPWNLVKPVKKASPQMGMTVLATGPTSVFMGKVQEIQGDTLQLRRIWRDGSRIESTGVDAVIVQNRTKEFGQVVFYNKRGYWNQGIALFGEERHIWIIEGLGGAVVRVAAAETNTWNPDFSPEKDGEVEACRGGAAMLVHARVRNVHEEGLFFDVVLDGGQVRYRVPFWEILPPGTVL